MADEDWDLGDCPWYQRIAGLPGHDPAGTCNRGCREEPSCQTDVPSGGWPSQAIAVRDKRIADLDRIITELRGEA